MVVFSLFVRKYADVEAFDAVAPIKMAARCMVSDFMMCDLAMMKELRCVGEGVCVSCIYCSAGANSLYENCGVRSYGFIVGTAKETRFFPCGSVIPVYFPSVIPDIEAVCI